MWHRHQVHSAEVTVISTVHCIQTAVLYTEGEGSIHYMEDGTAMNVQCRYTEDT